MGQAAYENAVGGEIDRPQLYMRFQEKTIGIERHLEELRQLLVVGVGDDTGTEHQKIRWNGKCFPENHIPHRHRHRIAVSRDGRFVVKVIPDKNNPRFARLPVPFLTQTVGADISEGDVNRRRGIALLECNGVFYRVTAADTAAVPAFLVSGTDALDHHDGFERVY